MVTEEDAAGIALAAAALVYLYRLGRDPYRCRILIAGAIRMPILSPLLLATGIPDITLWNSADGTWFPLHRAARDADVVIDLQRSYPQTTADPTTDSCPVQLDLDRPEGSVITRRGLDARALTAPGLLRALTDHPAGALPLGSHSGLGLYRVCVQAVAHATPPRRQLHDQPLDCAIPIAAAAAIADAVAAALHLALLQAEDETKTSCTRSPIDGRTHTE